LGALKINFLPVCIEEENAAVYFTKWNYFLDSLSFGRIEQGKTKETIINCDEFAHLRILAFLYYFDHFLNGFVNAALSNECS